MPPESVQSHRGARACLRPSSRCVESAFDASDIGEARIDPSPQNAGSIEQPALPTSTGHDSLWLRLIGFGKLVKAALLVAVGIWLIRLMGTNFGEQMSQAADLLRYSTVSRVVSAIFDKASLLSDQRLKQFAVIAFGYAATELLESYGLIRRRLWGEYITLSFTVAFLPFDIYEIFSDFTWPKLGFTVLNGLVAWYLIWHIQRKRRKIAAFAAAS